MTRRSLPPAYFEALYARDPDPWRFASSDYERDKYTATLSALRPRYRHALEVGCSIGVLTALLAPRCDALLALDVSDRALTMARERCAAIPGIAFARMAVPGDWPPGDFDLILLSEVLYYLSPSDLAALARRVAGALVPGGDCVLVHWTGETDYPLGGDAAVTRFLAAMPADIAITRQERSAAYRLDALRRHPAPPASR